MTVAGRRVPTWTMVIAAMLSIQLSSAFSVGLIDVAGSAGTAWLRLVMGSLILLAIVRPPLRSVRRQDVPVIVGLGVCTGLMMICFLAAIERIALGTAVAIEFLGPLSVAALRSPDRRTLVWPGLALVGVVLLTEPWRGEVDLVGVGFAALAGCGWGTYILLTQRIGDRFSGVGGLAMTIPIAALLATPFGLPQAGGALSPELLAAAAGLAVLAPVLPFALEMLTLRRMTQTAFGTLMALEPAIALVIGLVVLHQLPSWIQATGIGLVVLAGAGAQRGGARQPVADPSAPTAAGTA